MMMIMTINEEIKIVYTLTYVYHIILLNANDYALF